MDYIREKSIVGLVVLIFITLTFMDTTVGWAQSQKPYTLPKTIYWATKDIGTHLYSCVVTIAEQIGPQLGRKFRIIPLGPDVDQINMLRSGKVSMGCFSSDNYWASMGFVHYATFALGPQPLRLIWSGQPEDAINTSLVTKTSGIKTPYDMKGKKLGRVVGAGWANQSILATLAFGKLTLDDVKVYDFSSSGAMYRALIEGKIDFAPGTAQGSSGIEAEASPYGLVIPRYPHEDKEGWERYKKNYPFVFPGWYVKGPGSIPGEKIPSVAFNDPNINTLASTPEEFVYEVCKAIHSRLDKIVTALEFNQSLRIERGIIPEATKLAPFHPGARKYFKEIGVWTKELEDANNKRLAHLEKVNKRWEAFVEEAEEKMAKTKKKIDIEKEWMEIVQKEIGVLP